MNNRKIILESLEEITLYPENLLGEGKFGEVY